MHSFKSLPFLLLFAPVMIGCGPKAADPDAAVNVIDSDLESKNAVTQPADAGVQPNDTDGTSTVAASNDASTADLSGRILLDGDVPPPRKLSITKDVETCGAIDTIVDITGTDGGVAEVVIEVKGVEGDKFAFDVPKEGYVMRQKDCQFKPNLLVIPSGKEIQVYNDDPVGHNVNTGDWNMMQPAGPDPIVRPIDNKAPLKIGCNIHSWMEAWIYPVQNPFFAVTDEKGGFEITGIPPGKYRVNIWHASLGRKSARLTFQAGKTTTLEHEFKVK